MKTCLAFLLAAASLCAVCTEPRASAQAAASSLGLAGEFLIPAGTPFDAVAPSNFGGISGLATLPGGCELLAISDDGNDSRMYRMRLTHTEGRLQVRPVQYVPLERASGAPARLDPEGIALTQTGSVLVSSEGFGEAPRLPPAILEYTQEGRFIRQLPVPSRFRPNARGPLTTGVRRNGGFESLTLSPDFSRLFTANELPLAQDGAEDSFARQRVRLVEYVADAGSYRPAREFAYDITPLERPSFASSFSVNGLVELLASSPTELLALERGFVQVGNLRLGLNFIRLFQVSLEGATDISSFDALAGAGEITPVQKTLVLDFSRLPLSLRLRNLENFEGLAWVGDGARGARRLLAVSDDNFNPLQLTAFLLLEPGSARGRPFACDK